MKIVIELTLEEALDYLYQVGKTSVDDRDKFFEQYGIVIRERYDSRMGPEDIFGLIYDKIQQALKETLGDCTFVYTAYKVGNFVVQDKELAKLFEGNREPVLLVRKGDRQ